MMMTSKIEQHTPVDDIRSAFDLFDQHGKVDYSSFF